MTPCLLLLLVSAARAEPVSSRPVPVALKPAALKAFEKADSTAPVRAAITGGKPEDFGDDGEPGKKEKKGHGLRIFGLELSGDRGAPEDLEPYNDKSAAEAFDWDIRARVKFDGLGARAKYRNPSGLRSFQVGALKYFDLPALVGLDQARDAVYGAVGATPDKPTGGFELGVSGAMNQYLGGATTYDQRSSVQGSKTVDRRSIGMQAGWSPLGDNTGKPWNYTVLLGVSHERRAVYAPDWAMDRSGLGLSAGVAYQRALQDAVPWLKRGKGRVWVDGSAVRGVAANAALELTVAVTDSLGVTGGATARWMPSPEKGNPEEKTWDFGGIFGLDLAY